MKKKGLLRVRTYLNDLSTRFCHVIDMHAKSQTAVKIAHRGRKRAMAEKSNAKVYASRRVHRSIRYIRIPLNNIARNGTTLSFSSTQRRELYRKDPFILISVAS
ncbi:hypothetical protein TWF694_008569 [Orbilia ellipsospora]|uniref:Uncharacterized protein n=1 Tax=Orbilia ellipsospora TaxID=2528407 RepID=A0AAV9XGK1_9PEZI